MAQTVSTTSRQTGLDEAVVEEFRTRLRGQVIGPGDPDYDELRRVQNGMIDRYPRLIARCRDAADVIAAVNYGRERRMAVAVRGGGHNAAGLGTCDDGLVIDLSPMCGVRVDPATRTVRAEGGCVWGDVDHATHAFGLATPSGIISTTGVGGLTLGGGIGNLTRGYGLTIDNLLAVDMVLADGRFVTASKDDHPELFWAIRGGGGNFGVVTSFLFQLHPISMVCAGPMLWHMEDAPAVLRWYREFILNAPEELGGWFAFLKVPPGPPFPAELHARTMCGIVWCYTGPLDQAETIFAPIRRLRPPAVDFVGPLPFPAFQSMFDGLLPKGILSYWRADFVADLSDEAIAKHVEHGAKIPTLQSTMHLYPIDGAAHRAARNDTAFSYRDANWAQVMVGFSLDPADTDRIKSWTIDYWEALHPYSLGGAYVNFMMDEGIDRVKATYRDNYDRLVEVKNKYDPTNFFHVNQNIRPPA
jgi:FAD/FMN-containing dehydrogenase